MRGRGLGWLAVGGLACLALPATTTAQQAATPSVSRGERAFQKCYACHALGEDDEGAEGPSLGGIVGRKVAALPGYAYSGPLRAYADKQPRWTRAELDAFLADPQAAAPGNAMGFFGIKDPAERAALIDYLAAR
ncbi:MAG: c-type cytochrome [Erythrobacter sp.]|uniref:c-type cytochrome n=1 Tax=Erythrobacter sp. TaxID=1042 RepID=UPI0025D9E380|nr:c-type cytochrome [Erythrobacter sp.]MCL9999916.1 c-type cytochrome [Erythrobacter sp.]